MDRLPADIYHLITEHVAAPPPPPGIGSRAMPLHSPADIVSLLAAVPAAAAAHAARPRVLGRCALANICALEIALLQEKRFGALRDGHGWAGLRQPWAAGGSRARLEARRGEWATLYRALARPARLGALLQAAAARRESVSPPRAPAVRMWVGRAGGTAKKAGRKRK